MKLLPAILFLTLASVAGAAIIVDHAAVADFDGIPTEAFAEIRAEYRFYYGHTSHGSQIVSGVGILEGEDSELYARPVFEEPWTDLGHNGDVAWVSRTTTWLDANPEYNVVMWSWCGGVADNTEAGIDIYLAAMNQLELDYPEVVFIYMTGHLNGTGVDGNLYRGNNQIRDYCRANNKILFDFADIESWDPDGNYYPDESDGCSWCVDWCAEHSCPSCPSCAHSHCFNCYLKGKGFWWMMNEVASLVETEPTSMGAVKTLFR